MSTLVSCRVPTGCEVRTYNVFKFLSFLNTPGWISLILLKRRSLGEKTQTRNAFMQRNMQASPVQCPLTEFRHDAGPRKEWNPAAPVLDQTCLHGGQRDE